MDETLNDVINKLLERAWGEGSEPSKDATRKAYLEGVEDTLIHIQEWIEEHKFEMEAPNGNLYCVVEVN